MVNLVIGNGHTIAGWKNLFEHERALCKAFQGFWENLDPNQKSTVNNLFVELKKKEIIIDDLKKDLEQEKSSKNKPPHTKEWQSAQKIVTGMAVAYYGYDTVKERSDVIKNIINDLSLKGISISRDTLKKLIDAGVEFLSSEV